MDFIPTIERIGQILKNLKIYINKLDKINKDKNYETNRDKIFKDEALNNIH